MANASAPRFAPKDLSFYGHFFTILWRGVFSCERVAGVCLWVSMSLNELIWVTMTARYTR